MVDNQFIADVSEQSFNEQVLERSRRTLVIADFWAAWCGPCQVLMPLLARLADEYHGQFFLAKINTDKEQGLAARYGIRSLPTVKFFRHGDAVDEFLGAQPESVVRAAIERHIPRAADADIDAARALGGAGALPRLRAALARDPGYDRLRLALVRTLLVASSARLSQPDGGANSEIESMLNEAGEVLGGLAVASMGEAQAQELGARLELARAAAGGGSEKKLQAAIAENPADSAARYHLAARKILSGEYDAGMNQFLEIVRRDRKFNDDAARKALIGVFQLLGNQNPLVARYRGLLSNTLN